MRLAQGISCGLLVDSGHLLPYQEYLSHGLGQLLLEVFYEVPFELGLGGGEVGELEFCCPAVDLIDLLSEGESTLQLRLSWDSSCLRLKREGMFWYWDRK